MDAVLRARLHISEESAVRLNLIRMGMNSIDAASRTFLGKPFFALRESDALLDHLTGMTSTKLLRDILCMNGGTGITAHGLENVPAKGRVVIASTHPTGMFDFVAHAGALAQLRPDLKVVANREAERFLGPDSIVAVDIDKENRAMSATATFTAMREHLEQEGALLIFGAGRVPYRKDGQLVEPEWRSGTSRVSQICRAPIIPAGLNARNSSYYYRTRRLAQFLSGGNEHVGAMIGSLRYTAELLEKLGGQFDVHYGAQLRPGSEPQTLKATAEGLVPGLYSPS